MLRLVIVGFFLPFLPALASAAQPTPTSTRANGDLAIQARAILRRYCTDCHKGEPGPPPGKSKLNLTDYKQVIAKNRKVPFVAPGGRSQVLELVKDGSMPPANLEGPNPKEIEVLEQWIKAQAPAYPAEFDERFTLDAIAKDLENAKTKDPDAEQNLRYVSFAHLIPDGEPTRDLVAAEQHLNEVLTGVTGKQVTLEPVDPTATLYRIDLKALGWKTGVLFDRVQRGSPPKIFPLPLRPFDLLLLEYPYGVLSADEHERTKRLDAFLAPKNQLRPVPFVRGDWLTNVLRGKTPLAHDIASLAAADGPRVPRVRGGAELRVPKSADGRTLMPPLSAWYTGDVMPDSAPFKLTAELIVDREPVKSVKEDQPFKLRVSCNESVNITILMIMDDGQVKFQEIDDPRRPIFVPAGKPQVFSPGEDGFVLGTSATFVLFAWEYDRPVPPPVIVRSQHDNQPVWRFILEPTNEDRFDPNKVVRKVIPIIVTKK